MSAPSMTHGDIGDAVHMMRQGAKVRRAGWNGKGMFIWLRLGSDVSSNPNLPDVMCLGYIEMFTADRCLVPWLCSQTDMLASDWETIEE